MNRDAERLEEEVAGVARPARPNTLSGAYLMQALDELHNAGDPAHLFAFWRAYPPKDPGAERPKMLAAANAARLKAARTAVLFAALAAESYVNEFLDAHGVLERWDRQEPHRKYLKGTEEAYGSPLFFADREAYPVLVDLFKLRHRLVHPKPGFGVPNLRGEVDPEFEALFGLPTVARYITMVGGSADALTRRAYGLDQFDIPGTVIWLGRGVINAYAKRLAKLPEWDATGERAIFRQAGDYVMSMEPLPDDPDASWTRLRKARAKGSEAN